VIVRHGKFLSTYSGLSSANVSKGQQVKLGQVLGTIAEKAGGLGELDFIITNDKNSNQNPRLWLR
jgi:septal ring factor EnvC (AmiA/AmiB activator)